MTKVLKIIETITQAHYVDTSHTRDPGVKVSRISADLRSGTRHLKHQIHHVR